MRVLDATVTRRTRSGDILGPQHRMPVETALKAMTLWSAYQLFEENDKGSIEVGKRADFVILTGDPTAVDPETLDQLVVAETIKDGASIYTAPPEKLRKADRGTDRENPVSTFLATLAAERDFRNLPEKRQTRLNRKIMAKAPHNRGCVSAVMLDLTRAMMGET
jgi:urease alpha subunit